MSASAVLEGPIPHSYARIMLHAYYSDLHVYDEPAGPTAACSLREQARVGKPYSLLTRRSLAPTPPSVDNAALTNKRKHDDRRHDERAE